MLRKFLARAEREQYYFELLVLMDRSAECAVGRHIDLVCKVGQQVISLGHVKLTLGFLATIATAARYWLYFRKTLRILSTRRRAAGCVATFQAKRSARIRPSSAISRHGSSKCIR